MHFPRLRNERNDILLDVTLTPFAAAASDNEKDVEAHFKAYIETDAVGWVRGRTYARDKDLKGRYAFRNDRKGTSKGKPDYIFYDAQGDIVGICDVKSTKVGALEGLSDAKAYVDALTADYGLPVRLAAGFDGTSFLVEYRTDTGWERVLIGSTELSFMPTPALLEFIARSQNRIRDVDETGEVDKELLRNFFRKCDEIIRLSPIGTSATEKFIELSAIIFLKMFSLKNYDADYIAAGNQAVWTYARQGLTARINSDFVEWLEKRYRNLFIADQPRVLVRLDAERLRQITRLVDRLFATYELTDFTNLKGDVLEFFQMESKDRKIGEFFTPRHIIRLMVNLVDPRVFPAGSGGGSPYIERVYDPACGTGGFLIEVFNRYKTRYMSTLKDPEQLKEGVFHGTELKANTTLLAKLNMILIGDGHNNIINNNAFSYRRIETLPRKKDALGNYIPVEPRGVEFYEDAGEKVFHVVGDRTRKVTVEAEGTTYWVFDELGSRVEVPADDLISHGRHKRAPDGSPVAKVGDRYFKKHVVRHFELKNDLQEEKIPCRFEDVLSVNPRLREAQIDGKPNPRYHAHFGDFDLVLANQPFGLSEPPKADYHFAEHMLASLHDGIRTETRRYGRVACIVGNGFLHDPVFEAEREALQSKYVVKCIISLPEKVFAPYVKTIKSNILILEKRAPKPDDRTYFVKLTHDGFTQDDRRLPDADQGEIRKLLMLWRGWEGREFVDPDTGLTRMEPAHMEEAGFAEYHQIEAKSWAVNYYVRPPSLTFTAESRPLDGHVEERRELRHPKDVNGPDELVEVLGVSRTYGIISSERKAAREYNQKYKVIRNGDFAYNPARANIGSIARYEGPEALISPFYTVFSLIGDELQPEFLLHFLKSRLGRQQIEGFNFGGIRNSLAFDDLRQITVPFLDRNQQRSFLHMLEHASSTHVRLVDSFKALGRSGLPDSLRPDAADPDAYDTLVLDDVVQALSTPVYGISTKSDEPATGGTPMLKMHNIMPVIDDIVDIGDVDTITADARMLAKYRVQPGDILINRTNSFELVGKSGMFAWDAEAVYASYLMRVRVAPGYSAEYVAFYLNLASTRRYIRERLAEQSGGQYNVNFEKLRTLPVLYPKDTARLEQAERAFRQYHASLKAVLHLATTLVAEISAAFDALLAPSDA